MGGEFRGTRAEEKRERKGPKVQLAAGRTPEREEMNIKREMRGATQISKPYPLV